MRPGASRWVASPTHRAWLDDETGRLLRFAEAARHPDGGFAELDARGAPRLDRPRPTWITARMTHVFALGSLLGRPGCGPYVDAGVSALHGLLRDGEHGGWWVGVDAAGAPSEAGAKRAYEHAFVVLAASSAVAAERPGAPELLDEALFVLDERFWDEAAGCVVEEWDAGWTRLDPYRGANAAMHTVEAWLAVSDVTGDARWRERALRIAERIVHGAAGERGWRLPEHYDDEWRPLPEYGADDPAHPFRPYGVTVGHQLEWARLCASLAAALGDAAPGWLLPDAAGLYAAAVERGEGADGAEGFPYTLDWSDRPVVRSRLHWVLAEAIGAAAVLGDLVRDDRYERDYRRWWDLAAHRFLDRDGGSWWHELDPSGEPAGTVWDGKPDAYHAVQATLLPRLPATPTLATALRAGLLR